MNLELYLPFPPSVNNYYVKTKKGVRISEKGRKFRDLVEKAVVEQIGAFEPLDYNLLIEVVIYPPDLRKRDLDNFTGKALLDALTHSGIWTDDSLIKQSFCYTGAIHKPSGSCWVRVGEAGPILPVGFTP